MAWLRLYDTIPHDPKAQALPGDLFKFWINALCLAKRHDGKLPDLRDAAWKLRLNEKRLTANLNRLVDAKLFELVDGVFSVHDWDHWQYPSDVSTERTRRFRERNGNAPKNGLETVYSSVSVLSSDSGSEIEKGWVPTRWLKFSVIFPGDVFEFDYQTYTSVLKCQADEDLLITNTKLWAETQKWLDGFHPSCENYLSKRIWKQAPKPERSSTKREAFSAKVMEGLPDEI